MKTKFNARPDAQSVIQFVRCVRGLPMLFYILLLSGCALPSTNQAQRLNLRATTFQWEKLQSGMSESEVRALGFALPMGGFKVVSTETSRIGSIRWTTTRIDLRTVKFENQFYKMEFKAEDIKADESVTSRLLTIGNWGLATWETKSLSVGE